MTVTTDDLRARAQAWIADDPDTAMRDELSALMIAGDWKEIADRFAGRLEFGTAGLRGVLGAGPNRMNRAVVRAASAGLCAYLEQTTSDAKERGITIGYDGRRLSLELARETVEVATARGFRVHLFESVEPTPVLAFACKRMNAAAGVMVTASHNPPEYNGYKVYWGNGAQIVPPHDVGIAAAIDAVGPLMNVPLLPFEQAKANGLVTMLGKDLEDEYHTEIQKLLVAPTTPRDLRIAYTALHGVGDRHVRRALATAGFTSVHSVASQAEPDGAFPTVRFPNPEEQGAMDAVLELAREVDAEVVLANDPDADRLAVAVRTAPGSYVQLTGNEVGCLLGHYLLEHGAKDPKRTVISSIVSSPMLGAIALAHGAHWEHVLTGFKWIANRAMELEKDGYRFVFGYEEALGYTVGSLVRDKDGVSAALLTAEMTAWCKAHGRSLIDELELMSRRYGLFLSRQVSVTMKGADGAQKIARIMDGARANPPETLGTHAVLAMQDLARGERRVRGGTVEKLALPPSNVIAFELDGGHRVMLRPSGTEPKIKYYFDLREVMGEKEPVHSARARGERMLESLVEAFLAYVGPLAG
ncbi:Phosphoglucomutase phosphomannomutase alpha beta alpha domain i [Sandaracinus amylolyticus]|nr:phospho-sugar mutase [Sandaracinus amylolyticus]UJR78788.1 Phosphoglucomutase phosphomannomutase alpha beta alpha domain i [Sandaracinus amylolyticus]